MEGWYVEELAAVSWCSFRSLLTTLAILKDNVK